MVRTVREAGPHTPETLGEDQGKEEEEAAGYLQPQDAAHAPEGTEKASYAARHAAACKLLDGSPSSQLAYPADGNCLSRGRRSSACARSVGHALAGDASCNPQPDAQGASDAFCSHFVMMVSGQVAALFFHRLGGDSHLLSGGNGSKVEESKQLCLFRKRWPLSLEVPMTTHLRELIQQLGEAIHESVIESEQIAGVVQDIRNHGFDVLLMLEATIGLNDVAAKEAASESEEAEGAAGENGDEAPFTQNDLSFLRSLRISIAGEQDEPADPEQH